MNIAVLGLWHPGSVTAACTAAEHFRTVGIDDDPGRVAGLSRGEPPLYEPGIAELVKSGLDAGNLRFTTNISAASEADVVWVCYDTPVDDDQADVGFVTRRVEAIFKHLGAGFASNTNLELISVGRIS
jgi:UDPglucose 6-dehydrogenase